MRPKYLLWIFTAALLLSCKKNDLIIPQALFSFRGDMSSTISIATYDTCTLFNSSVNSDSSFWTLGNGVTSKGSTTLLSYDSSGTYDVTLTVKSKDGHTSSQTKKVVVLDRVLKDIVINKIFWDTIPNSIPNFNAVWPASSSADVFVQIQKYTPGDSIVPYSGILPNSPILFKSPVIYNVLSNTTQLIGIPLYTKFIVDKKAVLNRTLVVSLMAIDKNGTLYSIQTSLASGVSFGIYQENFSANFFKLTCTLFSSIELDCDYE